MKKNLLLVLSFVFVISNAFCQNEFSVNQEVVLTNISDKGSSEVYLVSNAESAVYVLLFPKNIKLNSISNTKKINPEKILDGNIEKLGTYESFYHNPKNNISYVTVVNFEKSTKTKSFYLQKLDVFEGKLKGKPVKVGQSSYVNAAFAAFGRINVSFNDNGDVVVYSNKGDYNKFPEVETSKFTEDLQSISKNKLNFQELNKAFNFLYTYMHSYKNDFHYFIFSGSKKGSSTNENQTSAFLYIFDKDGNPFEEGSFEFKTPPKSFKYSDGKFTFTENDLYITAKYSNNNKESEFPILDHSLYVAKFNLENREFVYENEISLDKIIKPEERKFFQIKSGSGNHNEDFTFPRVFHTNSGIILLSQCYADRNTDIYQRSDLFIKLDNDGKLVKSQMLKKYIKSHVTYKYNAYPLYVQNKDGSIICFYISNPADPKMESNNSVSPKFYPDVSATNHFVVISTNLDIAKPINVQKNLEKQENKIFINNQYAVMLKSVDEESSILVNVLPKSKIAYVSFTEIKGK